MSKSYQVKVSLIYLISLCFMILLSELPGYQSFANGDDLNPGVYPLTSKPFDITYEQWIINHTKWIYSIPEQSFPLNTPEKCAISQDGPVWFLSLSLVDDERTCKIPAGKAILLPITAGTCVEPMVVMNTLYGCAREGNEKGDGRFEADIDGKKINNIESYRITTSTYLLPVKIDNIFHDPVGIWNARTDGIYLFLEPLSPGNHTIHTFTQILQYNPSYDYISDLTYHLIVTK